MKAMNKQELKEKLAIECTTIDRFGAVVIDKTPAEMIDWVYNIMQEAIADHEEKQNVIKVKALRKKGTDKWFHYLDEYHSYVALDTFKQTGQGMIDAQNIHPFPPDAELVDIEIRIVEPLNK